jgi:predicted RND superfamily exporter protein
VNAEKALARLSRVLPLLLLALAPLLALGSLRAVQGLRTNVLDWLPEHSPELATLRWYDARFGSDQVLVVSWEGATLDDSRLDAAVRGLSNARNAAGERLFRQVVSGRTVLGLLTGRQRLPREEAARRMTGWMVGEDGSSTALVAMAGPAGAADPGLAEEQARAAAAAAGVPHGALRVAGSLIDATAIDRASSEGLGRLGAAAAVVGLVAALLLVHNRRSAAAVVAAAAVSSTATLSLANALGIRLDALGIMAPVLALVLSVSGGMHLDRYLTGAIRTETGAAAVLTALRRSIWPIGMALVTTAAGFGSLAVASTLPVRRFALVGSLTVVVVAFSLLVVWPALAVAFRAAAQGASGPSRVPVWRATRVVERARPILFGWSLLTLVAALGLLRLHTTVGIGELLPSRHGLVQDYRWLETHLGAAIPVELVVVFPGKSNDLESFLARAGTIRAVRSAVAGVPGVGGTLAADTFLPDPTRRPGRPPNPSDRAIVEMLAFVRPEADGSELWRVSARVSAFRSEAFEGLTKSIERAARESLGDSARDVVVAGGVTMVARAQQRLLHDLAASAGVALLAVVALLWLGLRSFRDAVLAVVPNVVPLVVVFGSLGWAGVAVDLGVAMTASVALGLAVDSTCHLFAAFRVRRDAGDALGAAAGAALSAAGGPAARSTVICVAALSVFALADFLPVARFGWLMSVLLAVAAAADLLLLPALLAVREGRPGKMIGARVRNP